jgi:lipoprotein signal peptidase
MLSRWLGLSALVILLDQASKLYISSHFAYGETLPVLSVFSLVLWHNTGAAFSFLSVDSLVVAQTREPDFVRFRAEPDLGRRVGKFN